MVRLLWKLVASSFRFSFLLLLACQSPETHVFKASSAWQLIPSSAVMGSTSHSICVAFDEKVLIFGGIDADTGDLFSSRLGIFDLKQNRWTISQSQGPEPLNLGSIAQFDQAIIVFGGETAKKLETNQAFRFGIREGVWEKLPESNLTPRKLASITRLGDHVLIFGGIASVPINDWASYDVRLRQWQVRRLHDRKSRVSHIAVAISKSELFIWGGYIGREKQADGFILSLDSDQIIDIPQSPILSARANARAKRIGNEILIWGGATADGQSNSGGIFDIETRRWRAIPPIPERKFNELRGSEIVSNDQRGFYLLGGRFGLGDFNDELWYFDLGRHKWFKHPAAGHPTGRLGHCVASLGKRELLLYGGITQKQGTKTWAAVPGLWILNTEAFASAGSDFKNPNLEALQPTADKKLGDDSAVKSGQVADR